MPHLLLLAACGICATFFLLRLATLWLVDGGVVCHANGSHTLWGMVDLVLGAAFALLALESVRSLRSAGAAGSTDVAAVLASERWRIAQDLHDGVGGHLVHALAMLGPSHPHQDRLRGLLEQALIELKGAVDAIDADGETLAQRLARLRYRIQPSLDRLGIRMQWQMTDLPPGALDAARTAHVLRIAQEALCNVVRHAQASVVEVALVRLAGTRQVLLEIRDDGRGIEPQTLLREGTDGGGRGLAGMRRRAQMAGAELQLHSQRGVGTCLRLIFTLDTSPQGLRAPP